MTAAVRFHPAALAQLEALDRWWRENRPAAAAQGTNEAERIIALLREAPGIGAPYPHASVPDVRVVRLTRTPYRLFYVHDASAGEVVVLALWSGLRGHGPLI